MEGPLMINSGRGLSPLLLLYFMCRCAEAVSPAERVAEKIIQLLVRLEAVAEVIVIFHNVSVELIVGVLVFLIFIAARPSATCPNVILHDITYRRRISGDRNFAGHRV